jgi:hypothetical protein
MQRSEIISRLTADPLEVIYAVTMRDMLDAIAMRMGDDALTLSSEDLLLARDEVRAVLEHQLEISEFIDIGLDTWEITRTF